MKKSKQKIKAMNFYKSLGFQQYNKILPDEGEE